MAHVRALDDTAFRDFHGRRLVEAAIDLVCAYLLLRAAQRDARKLLVARYFVEQMSVRVEGAAQAVVTSSPASSTPCRRSGATSSSGRRAPRSRRRRPGGRPSPAAG